MRFGTQLVVALALARVASAQESHAELVASGQRDERAGNLSGALATYDRAVATNAEDWRGYLLRGQVRFRLGDVAGSLDDFDTLVALEPEQEPYLWQRGISQYYEERFDACRQQFEVHRTVNPDDVENAVWHFLCVARADGFAPARRVILPVGPDPRPPMTTVYDLFRGKARIADVLAAAGLDGSAEASPLDGGSAAFYAHLYIALYLEAIGQDEEAYRHLEAAAAADFPHYMGDVARVHLGLLDAP